MKLTTFPKMKEINADQFIYKNLKMTQILSSYSWYRSVWLVSE